MGECDEASLRISCDGKSHSHGGVVAEFTAGQMLADTPGIWNIRMTAEPSSWPSGLPSASLSAGIPIAGWPADPNPPVSPAAPDGGHLPSPGSQ